MPYTVDIDLNPDDSRDSIDLCAQAPAYRAASAAELPENTKVADVARGHHWLVHSIIGRDMLKEHLKRSRPDLRVSEFRRQPELDDLLDQVVDELDLRDLQQPKTVMQHLGYAKLMLHWTLYIAQGSTTTAMAK